MTKPATGEFSVCQFFTNGTWEYVRRQVSVEEALRAFKHYTTSVAARNGMVKEVLITDGGDYTNMHWTEKEGIIFPTPKIPADKWLRYVTSEIPG